MIAAKETKTVHQPCPACPLDPWRLFSLFNPFHQSDSFLVLPSQVHCRSGAWRLHLASKARHTRFCTPKNSIRTNGGQPELHGIFLSHQSKTQKGRKQGGKESKPLWVFLRIIDLGYEFPFGMKRPQTSHGPQHPCTSLLLLWWGCGMSPPEGSCVESALLSRVESIPAWERSVPSRVWPLLSRLLKDCVFSLRWSEPHSHLEGFSKHRTLGLTLESGVEPASQPFKSSRLLLLPLLVWRSQVPNNGHSAVVIRFYCILKFERIKKEKKRKKHPRYPGYYLEQLYQNFRHQYFFMFPT